MERAPDHSNDHFNGDRPACESPEPVNGTFKPNGEMSDYAKAYSRTCDQVGDFSNETLLDVWKAAIGPYAHPESGRAAGFMENKKYHSVILKWDDWLEILYHQIDIRGLRVT